MSECPDWTTLALHVSDGRCASRASGMKQLSLSFLFSLRPRQGPALLLICGISSFKEVASESAQECVSDVMMWPLHCPVLPLVSQKVGFGTGFAWQYLGQASQDVCCRGN